jgi:hypothetical protein
VECDGIQMVVEMGMRQGLFLTAIHLAFALASRAGAAVKIGCEDERQP